MSGGNLGLNVLFDSFPNSEAASASLYPYIDRAHNSTIHITTGARREQGRVFALQLKSRYPATDVILRILPDENPANHQRYTPDAFVAAFAPWAAGGLILSLNNEAGVGDLPAQNAWYTEVIEKLGRLGIRCATPSTQTHNAFDPAAFDSTYRMLAKFDGLFTLHYYFDNEHGNPIDSLLEPVTAYCKVRGIALRTGITELGYAERLQPQAGYAGRITSAEYARQLVAAARRWRDVQFFVYCWGNQAPWSDFDISHDTVIQDALVKFNQETIPVTPNPTIQIPAVPGTAVPSTVIETGVRLHATPDIDAASRLGYLVKGQHVGVHDGGKVTVGDYPMRYLTDTTGAPLGWAAIASDTGVIWIKTDSSAETGRVVIDNMPYSSEFGWQSGWNALCGETSLYMLLRYDRQLRNVSLPPEITPLSIAKYLGKSAKDFTNLAELKKAGDAYGVDVSPFTASTAPMDTIKECVDAKNPIIALIDYSRLPTRGDQGFGGGHILVVCGYSDQNIVTNDPDYTGRGGEYISYPISDFLVAWQGMGNTGLVMN